MRTETNFIPLLGEVYLCFMTPDNRLNIVTEQELSLKNFESNIRRLYIVGEDLLDTLYDIKASMTDFNKYGYTLLIQTNKSKPRLSDFKYNFSSFLINNDNPPVFENAIPLDILITSLNDNELNSNVKIKIVRTRLND